MITKELQQLSDKLTGGHTSAHEISKQVDYIEKNYEGGGSGGGVFMVEMGPIADGSTIIELKATWQEIRDAVVSGKLVIIYTDGTDPSGSGIEGHTRAIVTSVFCKPNETKPYSVTAGVTYSCKTPDERPNTALE